MKNEYETNRLTGEKDEITNNGIRAYGVILHAVLSRMNEPQEKAVALCGSLIPGASGLAILFAHPDNQQQMCDEMDHDSLLFGSLYFAASVENHPNGICCVYSPDVLQTALTNFKKLTDRDYINLNPNILEILRQAKELADNSIPENIKRLLAN